MLEEFCEEVAGIVSFLFMFTSIIYVLLAWKLATNLLAGKSITNQISVNLLVDAFPRRNCGLPGRINAVSIRRSLSVTRQKRIA